MNTNFDDQYITLPICSSSKTLPNLTNKTTMKSSGGEKQDKIYMRIAPSFGNICLAHLEACSMRFEGMFTSSLKDVRPSTAMTTGWQFTGSAFTLEIRK